jgi:tetratricopeptide (TPR) repeat protein
VGAARPHRRRGGEGGKPARAGGRLRRVDRFVHRKGPPPDEFAATRVLATLRGQRQFDLLHRCAEAFLQEGLRTPSVRKLYAQALLDQGRLAAALPFLQALVEDTAQAPEDAADHAEARGLLGRAWKQVYVDAHNPRSSEARIALNRAIAAYREVYRCDPAEYAWHGINAAALLHLADVDGVQVHGVADPDWRCISLSEEILGQMNMKWLNNRAKMLDCATAMEACVALRRHGQAREWLGRYVREPGCDAFELASTLWQMVQVWRLDTATDPGASLLPVLSGEQISRSGGRLRVRPEKLKIGKFADYKPESLEKVFGKVRYVSYKFMAMAIECARSVARIEDATGQGMGTGFALRGGDLHPALGDEFLLVTNAHVVSADSAVRDALRPDEALVSFELLKQEAPQLDARPVTELLWSSPPWELDASLLRLGEMHAAMLKPLPITHRLPLADGEQRVYVIGHPRAARYPSPSTTTCCWTTRRRASTTAPLPRVAVRGARSSTPSGS